jgi:dTDP-4-amino-4,6-dideoxygalactose transaminase
VVTTAFTFMATVAPIVLAGAHPVLVDVDAGTGLLQIDAVESAITPRTAVLLPVHLYGQTVDLGRFRALADRHKLFLLEDAAQAHGARWRARRAGSIGDASKLRDHGRIDKYRHDEVGTNARLDTLQAAVLLAKLPHLDAWNEQRRRHAAAYDRAFASAVGVEPIRIAEGALPVYHQYVVRLADRDSVRDALAKLGISTGVHYPVPLNRQPALEGLVGGGFPGAESLAGEVLSLPVFPELSEEQRDSVSRGVTAFTKHAGAAARDVLRRGVGNASWAPSHGPNLGPK